MHDRHHVYTSQVHHIRNLIVHTGYNSHTNLNDIALMKLDKPVDINTQYVRAACLPDASDSFDQMTCTVTGWGATYFGESATCRVFSVRGIHWAVELFSLLKKNMCRRRNFMNYHEGKLLKVSHCYLNINLFKRLILYFTQ